MLLVVCKLAKIWFIMQCTLSQTKCSFYFFLKNKRFFSYDLFSAKSKVCFCSTVVTVAGISCCVALCPSTCLLNRSDRSGPCFGESCGCSWVSHRAVSVCWEGMSKPRAWFLTQVLVSDGIIGKPRNCRRTTGCLLTASGLTRVGSWAVGLEMAK